ncbi:MAG: glycosyl hydrolase [Bacteroidetes bacterium]|nr:glycosyl hydrolase [Bacteroidota bacterium]
MKSVFTIFFTALFVLNIDNVSQAQKGIKYIGENILGKDTLLSSFEAPPNYAKPRVYWWWLFNRVNKEGITRDLEQFKAKGISGVNLICTGGYAGKAPLPGVTFLGEEWRELFRHAVREAKRLNIEIGFNLAGGWTLMGPSVTKDNAMKKVVSAELSVVGPTKFSGILPQPEMVEGYYHDILVQAFRVLDSTKRIDPKTVIDLTSKLEANGHFNWDVPKGKWVILRTGYTLTGHPWSKWHAYPEGDTFQGGEGYEIDYLNRASLDDYFGHLGKLVIEEAEKAGGHLDYLWSDSWECGKLTWTQDFPNQFSRFRGYNLKAYLPVLAGYTVDNAEVSARFRDDFDRTIQDCIAENFYGHFADLCHQYGMKVGNEAGGPNDIPPQDVLKNFGHCDILAGEFWVNGHYNSPDGYNKNRFERLNLKQTATAAHVYGKSQAQAEAFTQQEQDRTHWSLGPAELKPYANDAFCEGINRLLLHQATCQPPSDGKPGYEFCAGQHFTPNITWWEQSSAFFTYLSRCQYMLQQGKFVGDVCFYLGERPPALAPPKYVIPSLGPGYDCDYANAEVLLTRMSVKNGRIVLPDGMSYRLLVLQNCTSTSPEICNEVGSYQRLSVSSIPSQAMSLKVIKKIRELINLGATVVGSPPDISAELKNYPACDEQVRKIAADIWGDLDGKIRTERRLGKGRVIWGKTPREILLADGVAPDFTFSGQAENADQFDYIHRTSGGTEIYFVINRTNRHEIRDFTFRVAGKQPEIWNAVTGKTSMAKAYHQAKACTTLSLELDAFGSYFIVFRKPIAVDAKGPAERDFPKLLEVCKLDGPWNAIFDPEWGGPGTAEFHELISWTKRPEEGIKYYSGKATYLKNFDLSKDADGNKNEMYKAGRLFLDLGEVKNVAEVRLNGKKLGILWCAPWHVDITDAVKLTDNVLEVDVINLWANRVIGDLNQPKEKRFTKTHDAFRFDMLRGSTPLLESGLLGPVKVYRATE